MSENESIWKRLTRLFRSGPVVRHKVSAGEKMNEPQGTARAYKRELSSLYVNSLASYGQYERLARYCLDGDTLVYTTKGPKKIKELASSNESFYIFSYDKEKNAVVPALAEKAFFTKNAETVKIVFDEKYELICTADHPIMLRDGSYCEAGKLVPGTSCMPFSVKNFYDGSYNHINTKNQGWKSEHVLVAETFQKRVLASNEVVYHVDLNPKNNDPDNLRFMTRSEHSSYHAMLNNSERRWTPEARVKMSEFMKEFNKTLWTEEKRKTASEKQKENFKSQERRTKLSNSIKKTWKENREVYDKTVEAFQQHWKGKKRDEKFKEARRRENNSVFRKDLTVAAIEYAAVKTDFINKKVCEELNCQNKILLRRIREAGFSSWKSFTEDLKKKKEAGLFNHKVTSVNVFEKRDVYDLTTNDYHNFAICASHDGLTNTTKGLVFVHNCDYSEMEMTPEIASALNIYADEATCKNEQNETIKITSSNAAIKQILEELFHDVLDIEFNLWSWTRNLCKYGDFCLFVDASQENGILNLLPIPINEIEREEGYDKNDPFAVRFRWLTQGNMILQNWQIIHMRLLGNDTFLPYGQSMIEPARRIWRQLILIEDAMLVYRIVRSPERRMFKIPVGNIPAEEVDRYMEEIQTKLKRNTIVDSQTGRVDLRYNPLSVDEDYFLPYRGTEGPTIETLPGGAFTGDIEDVQYIQNKMFSALHVPKAYLGYEQDIGSKATLAQQDVRFAKTIERIQKIIVAELNKIAIIHLALLGYTGEQLVNFKIEMASPSTIAEQQKLELWRMRFEIAGMAQEGVFDRGTIYEEIFQRNDKQIAKIVEGKRLDALEDIALEKIKTQATEQEMPPEGGETQLPGAEELPKTLGGEPEETTPENIQREINNPGSKGNDAIIATDKGKDLFSTGENQHSLVFGTEKQTASDPFDKRAAKRLVSKPFSETIEENWIKRSLAACENLDEQLKDIKILYDRKKKQ